MNKIQWVVDTILLERHDEGYGFLRIDEAAKKLGHSVMTTKYRPFSDHPDLDFLDAKIPTIFYGSCEFNRDLDTWTDSKKSWDQIQIFDVGEGLKIYTEGG